MACVRIAAYHLKPLLHGGSSFEILGRGLDVPCDLFLRQIDHVGGEEWLAMLLEISLICVHHTIQPRQQLFRAVIGVKNDRDTVGRRNGSDIVGSCNSSGDGGFLVLVGDTLNFVNSCSQPAL
jgi:hypothetical protein